MHWEMVPDLLLEQVYTLLNMRYRYYCSMVCSHWNNVFYYPAVWHRLEIKEHSFTYNRFNLYKGYQKEISHSRVRHCLARVGRYIRHLTIRPMENFYNLREFLSVLNSFVEDYDEEYPMPGIRSFCFTFACESQGYLGTLILGTGGEILDELKRLLGNLRGLSHLVITDLMLKNDDAPGLLEGVVRHCQNSLNHLEVINCTKERYPLFNASMFPYLHQLVLSPQQLTDDVALMVARTAAQTARKRTGQWMEVVIVQNKYTPEAAEAVTYEAWRKVRQMARGLKVRLEQRDRPKDDLLIQEGAPVYAVVYKSRYALTLPTTLTHVAEQYRDTLRVYAHQLRPRKHGEGRGFNSRADWAFVFLVRQCQLLHTLAIRERISTATVLLLASEGKALQHLHIRRQAVLLRCDWPRASHWTDEYYLWLKTSCSSYDKVEQEVSRLLGFTWTMLSDTQFNSISICK